MIAGDGIPVLPRGVRIHHDTVRDMWVLLAPERAITLDPIGHAILTEVDGTSSLSTIATTLSERFGAPLDQVTTDSAEFLTSLWERRMLDLAQ